MSFLKNFHQTSPTGKLLLLKNSWNLQGQNLEAGSLVLCVDCSRDSGLLKLSIFRGQKKIEICDSLGIIDSRFSIIDMGDQKPLEGKKIAITGALKYVRPFYKTLIELAGGKYSNTVTRDTTHLVTDELIMTTKMKTAKQQGINIISSLQLQKMINGQA